MKFDGVVNVMDVSNVQISHWFLFGWVNIIAGKLIFMALANRRGVSFSKVLVLTMAYTTGAGIGAVLVNSIISVLTVGILFFILFKWILGIDEVLEDLLALNFAIMLGIGRIGCYLSGCCFGTPTSLPWGVTYSEISLPYWLHRVLDLIPEIATRSATIHPVQLYESLFVLILGIVVYKIGKNRIHLRVTVLPGFLIVYFLGRIWLESMKAFANTPLALFQSGGLNGIQWLLLVLSLFFAGIMALSLQNSVERQSKELISPELSALLIFTLFVLTISKLHPVHFFQMLGLSILYLNYVLAEKLVPNRNKLVWAPGILITVFLIFVYPIQTAPDVNDSESILHRPPVKSVVLKKDQMVTLRQSDFYNLPEVDTVLYQSSYSLGGYYHQIVVCGDIVPMPYAGAAYNYKRISRNNNVDETVSFKANSTYVMGAAENAFFLNTGIFYQIDHSKIGYGIGLGGLYLPSYKNLNYPIPYPAFHLRFGSKYKNFSLGLMDHTFSDVEPVSFHISFQNKDKKFGISNFYYLPAFYLDLAKEKSIIRVKFTPPVMDASMGLGFTIQRQF